MSQTSTQEVLEERRGAVLWVTFNRPESRNAMTFPMYDRLGEICQEANQDDDLRCIVLTGAGEKAFVAGTDISLFRNFSTAEDALSYEQRMERNIGSLASVRVPVIAAIRGACTGGGFAIAGACDIRIGGPSARLGIPIARTLGNTLSMASLNLLVDLVGPAQAKELLFTARLLEAPEALAWGLLNEVTASDAEVEPRAQALAEQIAGMAPLTLRSIKAGIGRIMAAGHLSGEDARDLITMAYLSEDFKEGMEAFLAKRKPQWRGR
jgi:enoyl-CoA hydratase/carnithine racemase